MPGQTALALTDPAAARRLQWRAGQLPGQTSPPASASMRDQLASMEGRAIARPNQSVTSSAAALFGLQWRAGQLPGQTGGCHATPDSR